MKFLRPLSLLAASASAFVTNSGCATSAALSRRAFVVSSMSAAADFAQQEIEKNRVVIFSKSYCPYCTKTKELFDELKIDGSVVFELDNMANGSDIQAALLEMTGQRTVPNVFIDGNHIGGNDNVQAANKSGQLKQLLLA